MEQPFADYMDDSADELVKRYEEYLAGKTSAGYFDVEEVAALADYYLHKGRTKDSNRALDMGMRLHPASSELQQKRAKTYLATGDIHKALSILDRLPMGDEYEISLLRIEAFVKINRIEEADVLAETLLNGTEDDFDNVCLDIAFVFLSQEHFRIALRYLQQGDRHNPNNIDLLFELAFCFEQLDDYVNTEATYNRIIDIDAYIVEAWFNLGQVYFAQKKYQDALHAYEVCLTIDDTDALVCLQKGHIHFILDQPDEAIKCYETCLSSYDRKWQLYTFIGECYEKKEDYTQAIHYHRLSLDEKADNYEALVGIGLCLLELEQPSQALEFLQKALAINPSAAETWVYLGDAYSDINLPDAALEAYRHSLVLADDNPDALIATAGLLMDKEQYEEALPLLLKATTFDDVSDLIDLFVAAAYYHIGNDTAMLAFLDKACRNIAGALETFFELCPDAQPKIEKLLKRKI